MRLSLLLALLILVAPGAACVCPLGASIDAEDDEIALAEIFTRISGGDLTLEEWVVVLGPGHGYNVTRDGVVTLGDGSRVDIKVFMNKATLGKLWGRDAKS